MILGRENGPSSALEMLREMVDMGGPREEDFAGLTAAFESVEVDAELMKAIDSAFQLSSLQGLVKSAPYGYKGDFAIIEKIYSREISACPEAARWDVFFQYQPACEAVRNRRKFLVSCLEGICRERKGMKVLSVAAGPCREILDYLQRNPSTDCEFTCLDQDPKAISFASAILHPWRDRVRFFESNAFLRLPTQSFDFIYSSGLFDYLSDRQAIVLIKKLWTRLKPSGEMLIGNFSTNNPSRAYMEFGGWVLNHRTKQELQDIVTRAVPATDVQIDGEPLGINLFVSFRKPIDEMEGSNSE